jgi:gliding motility-associated-like protein
MDGASTLEDGTVAGLSVDSLVLAPGCSGPDNIKVAASNGAGDTTSYTLDGVTTNSTGIFPNIPNGAHSVHIQTSSGCFKDTTFSLQPIVPVISVEITEPPSCSLATGTITIIPADPTYPYLAPANCTQDNGSIAFSPSGSPSAIVSSALNGGATQTSLSFSGLVAGSDTLHLYSSDGCHYDSVLYVSQILNPEPAITSAVTNQECFVDNGGISLKVDGMDEPYTSSINGSSYTPGLQYNGLAPAEYKVSIKDKDACIWDTSITVQPYPKDTDIISIDTVNPVCTKLNSGSLRIAVQGNQAPYSIGYAGINFPSGSLIDGLNYGNYSLAVTNKDGCLIDSVHAVLTLDVTAACSLISIPNAFSPNGDGHNDVFHVIHSPYQTGIRLRVYDRLGDMVFSGNDKNEGWDGTFRGRQQPTGTYVWTVDYMDWDKEEKSLKGIVVLLR